MKTNHLIPVIIAIILTFSACREITVTTKVNSDGSFTRIITITGDSSDLFNKNLPYPVDDTWEMAVKHDTVDSALFVTYTKNYENSKQLQREIAGDTGWRQNLQRDIQIGKRFGLFYSYLTFTETIGAANPFPFLDAADYLSEEDRMWLSNEKQPKTAADTTTMDEVEDRAMEYLARSITAEIIHILETGISELDDPALDPHISPNYRDSIFNLVNDWAFDKPDIFIDSLSEWTGEGDIMQLKLSSPGLFSEFNNRVQLFSRLIEMEDYTQEVEMPGLVTETNSQVLKGNRVSWKVQSLAFLFNDYTMHIESRVVNYLVFIVAGAILLVLVLLLMVRAFK